MEVRILSGEERNSLTPDATMLVRKYLSERKIMPEILEQALLQSVFFAKASHRRMDAATLDLLLEKISEYEGIPFLDGDGEDGSGRYSC